MSSTIEVIEPATAEVMESVRRAGADEVDAAVAAARAAFPAWRDVTPGDPAVQGRLAHPQEPGRHGTTHRWPNRALQIPAHRDDVLVARAEPFGPP